MSKVLRTSLGEMQARGLLGRETAHRSVRMKSDAEEDKLWGEAIPTLTAQLSFASGFVFHTLPRMANKHSWVGGQEFHCPNPQIVPLQVQGHKDHSPFSPRVLSLSRLLGRNGCPMVPLPFSSSKYLEEGT